MTPDGGDSPPTSPQASVRASTTATSSTTTTRRLPDPRSRFQPHGVHGLSRAVDPDRLRLDRPALDRPATRRGSDLRTARRHVHPRGHPGRRDRAARPSGRTRRRLRRGDAGQRLQRRARLGLRRGRLVRRASRLRWAADAYQRFVDACHAKGLAVIQDVVYNHFGPSGNYAPRFGPYLDETTSSPWGTAINLGRPGSDVVRRFIIDNALMWLHDYHVDGLRLDAVHALVDIRAMHLLEELADEVIGAVGVRAATAVADRRIGPERSADHHLPGRRRLRAHRPVERRLPPRAGRQPHRRRQRATTRISPGSTRWRRCSTRGSSTTAPDRPSVDAATAAGSTPAPCPRPGWWSTPTITTRSATGPTGRACPADSASQQLQIAAALTLLGAGTPMIFMGQEWAGEHTLGVLQLAPRARSRGGRHRGPAPGVRVDGLGRLLGSRSAGPRDVPPLDNCGWGGGRVRGHDRMWRTYRDLIGLRRTHPDLVDPRFDYTSTRHRPGQQWFVVERGRDMAVAVNFSPSPSRFRWRSGSNRCTSIGAGRVPVHRRPGGAFGGLSRRPSCALA